MGSVRVYEWKQLLCFYKPSKVTFDFDQRTIEFERSLLPNGFWNLFPQKLVKCRFDEVQDAEQYSTDGMRCVQVKTAVGNRVFVADVVPRFDEFAADFRSVLQSRGNV
jgi:hypothetical protein